jgi:hypothetical protein
MDEKTKQFAIRVVIVTLVVGICASVFYLTFSPYRHCIADHDFSSVYKGKDCTGLW